MSPRSHPSRVSRGLAPLVLAALALGLVSACGSDAPSSADGDRDASVAPLPAGDGGPSLGDANVDSGPARPQPCAFDSPDCTPCVNDAVAAVNGLPTRGKLLGYNLNGFSPPSLTNHWEGVQRIMGAGGRYLAVSRRGAAMLDIVELASRKNDGAAFGSNREGGTQAPVDTAPPASDKIITELPQDPGYDHAGGMQASGAVLAVPLENGTSSRVVFFDVSSPPKPARLGVLDRKTIGAAGTASLAKLADGRFLLIVGRTGAQILDFYFSSATPFDATSFKLASTWTVADDGVTSRLSDGDKKFGDYQNLDLVRQCDGKLFLLGTHREGTLVGADYVDLFAVGLGAKVTMAKVAKLHVFCSVGSETECNFDAAAGSYVTPRGDLVVYAIEHENGGPNGSVKMEEL